MMANDRFWRKEALMQEYRTPALQIFVPTPLHLDQAAPMQ